MMSVDKEPAGEETAGLLGVVKDRGHVVSDVHLKSLTSWEPPTCRSHSPLKIQIPPYPPVVVMR